MRLTYTAATKECGAAGCFPFNIFGMLEEPVTRPTKSQILELSMFSLIIDSLKQGEYP